MPDHRSIRPFVVTAILGVVAIAPARAVPQVGPSQLPAQCDFSIIREVVWFGTERQMTIRQLAAYAAPVFWFSPDEPIMDDKQGTAIRIPEALPFESRPDSPVVYYQYHDIYDRGDADGPGYTPDANDKNNSIVDLNNVVAINLKYLAYFRAEEGLGGHAHDVEPAEFRIWVGRSTSPALKEAMAERGVQIECDELVYVVGVSRVTAEAHGLVWFYNVLEVDEYTKLPMHLLVEEGKHGMSTDKNSDGYYTPGFDVNVRRNDAWGVRDIIRGGALFTGKWEAWMAKVRRPEHRVFPPLPEDSPLREQFVINGNDGNSEYAPNNAIYELRAFPSSDMAGNDALLREKMHEKEARDWPELGTHTTGSQFNNWWNEGVAQKSFAISLRADGDLGLSFVFPFFLIRNFEEPMTGGWLVHRMYLKDKGLRDFGWTVMYMPSASRWFDTYIAAGAEKDREPDPADPDGPTTVEWDFVMETGIKFRANITKSPLKFLTAIPLLGTEYWGLRAGIKNRGWFDIEGLTYVIEFGAGVW